MAEAAIRWVRHHSMLSAKHGDGLIFGASSLHHCESNLAACGPDAGPLPEAVVEAMDEAWVVARPDCESYFRGYGAKPGGVETFLAMCEE